MDKVRKRVGIGTCSPIMLVLALILSFSFGDNIVLGDVILDSFGLKAWSDGHGGVHYTLLYTLAMVVIAYFIGAKYEDHMWARSGKNSAIFVLALLALIIIFDLVF